MGAAHGELMKRLSVQSAFLENAKRKLADDLDGSRFDTPRA